MLSLKPIDNIYNIDKFNLIQTMVLLKLNRNVCDLPNQVYCMLILSKQKAEKEAIEVLANHSNSDDQEGYERIYLLYNM